MQRTVLGAHNAVVHRKTRCHKGYILRAPVWLSRLSVQLLVLAQIITSQLVEASPALGSALTAQSLLGILSLSAPPPLVCAHAHIPCLKISKRLKNNLKN